MRKSPPSASCSSWFTSRTDMCARSSVELRTGSTPACETGDLRAISGAPAPGVDRCRLRLPDARCLHPRQGGERAELRTERHPVIGLGHDGGLAGYWIAQHGEAVACADH